jgi:hypothetical protein
MENAGNGLCLFLGSEYELPYHTLRPFWMLEHLGKTAGTDVMIF